MIITDDDVDLLKWAVEEAKLVTGGLDPRDYDSHEANIEDAARAVDKLVRLRSDARYCPLHGGLAEVDGPNKRCVVCEGEGIWDTDTGVCNPHGVLNCDLCREDPVAVGEAQARAEAEARLPVMREESLSVMRLQPDDVLVFRVGVRLECVSDLARERIVKYLKEVFGQKRQVLIVGEGDDFLAVRKEEVNRDVD